MKQQTPMHTEEAYIYDSLSKKIIRSIVLDALWMRSPHVPNKWIFLAKKYLLLAIPALYWHKQSDSYRLQLFNRLLHLESPSDIGSIQSIFIDYDYLLPLIKKNGIVIDAGAHIGEFALFAELLLKAQTIYSFEPILGSFRRLQKNSISKSFHAAICSGTERAIYVPRHTVMASGNEPSCTTRKETTSCIQPDSLPEVCAEDRIDLFKIDVEGMEYDVLTTSKHTLEKSRYIMIEGSIDRPATKPVLETIELLRSILPGATLIHVGKVFGDALRTDSADLLFENTAFHNEEQK